MGLDTALHDLQISAPDGSIDVVVAQPASGTHPGVLFYADIGGTRPTQVERILRLAAEGFVVAMPNLCYRTRRPPLFDFPRNMKDERSRARVAELIGPLTPEAIARDSTVYVEWLRRQPHVASGPLAVVGHCFSGAIAMRTAAARPGDIAFAASFHGGGLATTAETSPHRLLPGIRARLYFGHAIEDSSMPTDAIGRLDEALTAWGGTFKSETYAGAHHGWTASDGPAFHPDQAEHAFQVVSRELRESLGPSR
jgi:carboxymethylenebutenolidase